ncbi:MAG: ABC transporter substrate-binding protein [Azospirillaceae bacterium]
MTGNVTSVLGTLGRRLGAVSGLALAGALAAAPVLAQDETLRVVIHADLRNLDPIWTTAGITLAHGYMIYDKLYEFDSAGVPQPQMAEGHTVSEDGLVWTITLRDGLSFHDGDPVTAQDVVASLERWWQRDGMGQTLAGVTESLEAVDDATIRITLSEPFGLVLDALAGVRGNPPFIMPADVAATPADEQISDYTGSGPYVFLADAWEPGSTVVYERFADYVPRDEPADFMSGGKVVNFDRVEWVYIPDSTTTMASLMAGEVDIWELVPPDLAVAMEGSPGIVVERGAYSHGVIRPNHLNPPFDQPEARQALLHLVDQSDVLAAAIGDQALWQECAAYLTCGGPYESDAGVVGVVEEADIARAAELLEASGYDGSPIVILDPTDLPDLHAVALYVGQQLRAAGATVDVQAMDWSTLTSRRTSTSPVSEGGWNILVTYTGGLEAASPLTNITLAANCENAWFGWPCDQEIEDLRSAWRTESDVEARREIAEALQERAYEVVPYVPYGQFFTSRAHRDDITGYIPGTPISVYWNVDRAE